jgi:hypothetical protein
MSAETVLFAKHPLYCCACLLSLILRFGFPAIREINKDFDDFPALQASGALQ